MPIDNMVVIWYACAGDDNHVVIARDISHFGAAEKSSFFMSQPSEKQRWGVPKGARSSDEALETLQAVYTENEALFHQSNDFIARLYGPGDLSLGKRGVLFLLFRVGPQTVPQIAQTRQVSRQYIQKVVNQLAQNGYVLFAENEVHKRSSLVELTEQGRDYLIGRLQHEVQMVREMVIPFPPDKLQETATMLRAIREWQRAELQRLMENYGPTAVEPESDGRDDSGHPSEEE
jgi:DNA-binding MarR family transcriptional regulator